MAAKTAKKTVRHPPLSPDRVLVALASFGRFFVTPARIAEKLGASEAQVKQRLRVLVRSRQVESASATRFGGNAQLTYRLVRPD